MPIYDLLLVFLLTLIVLVILLRSGRYRGEDDRSPALFFFPLLLLLIWATGAWITPIGVPVAGVYWLNFALPAAFILVFLFALSSPTTRRRRLLPER